MKSGLSLALFFCLGLPAAGADPSPSVSDDFSKLDPAWGAANAVQSVAAGKLQFVPNPNTSYAAFREGNVYRDADVRVKVSLVKGGDQQAAGIVFWGVDYDSYYFAQLFSDGTVGVARRIRGRTIQPVPQAIRDFVRRGPGAVNEIRVVTRGNIAELFVNDRQAAEFRGFPPEAGGKVGVRAGSAADRYTWNFSEFSVRAPAAASGRTDLPTSADVVLEDDFSRLDPAWGSADEVQNVSDNSLRMTPKPNTTYSSLYNGTLFDAVDVRVNVTLLRGGDDDSADLLFWATDYNNYYAAQLYADGTVGIVRRQGGKTVFPVRAKVHDAVKKGLGQSNELRVATVGDTAVLYVNGTQVTSFRGFPPSGGAKIGLAAGSDKEPYTWAFAKLSVRNVAPSATSPRTPPHANDPDVLFADDFPSLDPAWGAVDALRSVAGGKLYVTPAPKTSATILYNGALFGDCDIRAQVGLEQGSVDSPAGIVFWSADYDNYYLARIYADGVVGIARRSQGKWSYPAGMKVYRAVREGVNSTNEIRVVTRGDAATMYVNDKWIATVKGVPPTGGSRIGVKADSADRPYRWSFGDFVVRRVSAAAEFAPPQLAAQPLAEKIVEAWKAAGAKVGWLRTNEFGVTSFVTANAAEKSGLTGELPAFQFTPSTNVDELAALPAVPVDFGVMMVMIMNPGQSAAMLDRLAGESRLRTLTLFGSLGGAGIKGLGRLQALQTLQLNSPKLTDAGLAEAASLVNLKALTLGSPLITDDGVRQIAGLTKLEFLNASGSQVTDAGLESLAGLTKLRTLNLSGTGITDAGLRHLARLSDLRSINLVNTKATAAGFEQLQTALPACRIIIQ